LPEKIDEAQKESITTILLIYDAEGNLVAESKRASEFAVRPGEAVMSAGVETPGPSNYADTFGRGSDLTSWLAKQIEQARKDKSYAAQSSLEHLGGKVTVRFESLSFPGAAIPGRGSPGSDSAGNNPEAPDRGGRDERYAVLISRSEDPIPEGASLITRQQWHDIKNHLGGLKLYATFLKKKLEDGEDQAIVEKLLNGINGLIDHLAQIRGGDAK